MLDSAIPPRTTWTFWRVVWATLVLVALGLSFWLAQRLGPH